jgi:hypothetical protein
LSIVSGIIAVFVARAQCQVAALKTGTILLAFYYIFTSSYRASHFTGDMFSSPKFGCKGSFR